MISVMNLLPTHLSGCGINMFIVADIDTCHEWVNVR